MQKAGMGGGFFGSIAETYDRYLGPLLFAPYALDLVPRLRHLVSGRVLETAAGTGILTSALARFLPPGVEIVATDASPAMLDLAKRQVPGERIIWQRADAVALPFADQSFDAVVCQFGVMFFPNKHAAYAEARRVLKPSARFLFNVWDRIEKNELAYVASEAIGTLYPRDTLKSSARLAHSYCDIPTICKDLQSVGFSDVELELVVRRSRAPSCDDAAIGFCQGTPLRDEIAARCGTGIAKATDAAARAIAVRFGDGNIDASMQALVVSASS